MEQMFNFCEYVTPSDFFERVKFYLTHTEIPCLVKLPLTTKRINVPGIGNHATH